MKKVTPFFKIQARSENLDFGLFRRHSKPPAEVGFRFGAELDTQQPVNPTLYDSSRPINARKPRPARRERSLPLCDTYPTAAEEVVCDLAAHFQNRIRSKNLAGSAWLQRFVVATVLRQLVDAQTYSPVAGLKYLVVLDELNRFAPKGGRDAITKLVELVASEMRSQGVLLFGAQQQASLVSEKLIENAGLRAVGKTGTLEFSSSVWRSLSQTDKGRADSLPPDEKLLLQDSFRKPMHIRVPFPAWAMRRGEAIAGGVTNGKAPHIGPIDD